MNKPIEVKMTEIARLKTQEILPGIWWAIIENKDSKLIKEYDLKLPDINYKENNIIISAGREIKKMTYTRASKSKTSYNDPYIGIATFRQEFYPHTMFVYKIYKIDLIDEDDAGYGLNVRIEDDSPN